MNSNTIKAIVERIKPRDFICLIGGACQQVIAKAFPKNQSVEYGIDYLGTFSQFRVFESYAHLHYAHGQDRDDNGSFYDTVILNYDDEEFPFSEESGDYYLFIGRLIDRKVVNSWCLVRLRIAYSKAGSIGRKWLTLGCKLL